MSRFVHAHAGGGNWHALVEHALARLPQARPGGALGFVYLDHRLAGDCDRVIGALREATGTVHWIGSVGMGVCSTGREEYDEPSLAIMLTDLGDDDFRLLPPIVGSVGELLAATHQWRERSLASVAVVHGDPSNLRLPQLIESLADGLEGGFLVGGLTSSEDLQVQIADQAVEGGLSGALLAGTVPVVTGVTQGCRPIGERHEITQAQRNILVEIDGRPALDVLKDDIGEMLARDLARIGGYIFAALPVVASDTGDYLVRNLVGIDPDQGLVAIGDEVAPGMSLQFARRDGHTARHDLVRMLEDLDARCEGRRVKGALYHTCLGRGRHLFGDGSAELRLVQDHLGDIPLVGFYANGEISHRSLYGYTGVLTLFLEP
jgi:small ligand-binding sensory domain FIST